jgi:hypothetical protein
LVGNKSIFDNNTFRIVPVIETVKTSFVASSQNVIIDPQIEVKKGIKARKWIMKENHDERDK